jgi:hypothetical protein
LTNTAHLCGGPERAAVADNDHARHEAARALYALREGIISGLRGGA